MEKATQKITATILGSGSSGGVPRVGGIWGNCDPRQPKNRRRRCSLLLSATKGKAKTQVLIDTGCDLREQLLDARVSNLDGVFYTHEHADHTHGIDDLRAIALHNAKRIDVYFGKRAGERIKSSFSYCFTAHKGSGYPPILNGHELKDNQPVTITGEGGDITLLPVLQQHGNITTFGFRVGNFMYSCDVSGFPEHSHANFEGLDTWVVDALRHTPHPSHLCLSQTLEWIERFKPRRAILTNLHVDMDFDALSAQTPSGVDVAYDGLVVQVSTSPDA